MISVLLGLVAAFSWSVHDLFARRFSGDVGPFRMSFWVMVAGAALLAAPVVWRGNLWQAEPFSMGLALAMGLVYAFALGALLLAFSLAPVSIVGPFTAGYPALVVVWGLINGLSPTQLQWAGLALVFAGVVVVSRFGPADAGTDSVAPGRMPLVIASAVVASIAFAAAVVMGQAATLALGEYEVTFLSRFPAALLLLPLMLRDRRTHGPMPGRNGAALVMAGCDTVAVTAINAAAHFPNRELGAMAISSYAAMAAVMAMLVLKERVMPLQWLGILMVVAGVLALAL
jgi:drug/metabolite transporter (DMT)-like permease